jgi:hypothetical protein
MKHDGIWLYFLDTLNMEHERRYVEISIPSTPFSSSLLEELESKLVYDSDRKVHSMRLVWDLYLE